MNDLVIYTDGACIGNGKTKNIGGWSFVITRKGELIDKKVTVEFNTTNNRQELSAVIEALEYCKNYSLNDFTIFSDSQYVVNGFNDWMFKWQRKNWVRGAESQPIPNADLWKRLWDLKKHYGEVSLFWVRGHNGNKWNEYADRLIETEMSKHASYG